MPSPPTLFTSSYAVAYATLVMLGGGEGGQLGAQAGVFQAMMQLLTAWETLKEEAPTVAEPAVPAGQEAA